MGRALRRAALPCLAAGWLALAVQRGTLRGDDAGAAARGLVPGAGALAGLDEEALDDARLRGGLLEALAPPPRDDPADAGAAWRPLATTWLALDVARLGPDPAGLRRSHALAHALLAAAVAALALVAAGRPGLGGTGLLAGRGRARAGLAAGAFVAVAAAAAPVTATVDGRGATLGALLLALAALALLRARDAGWRRPPWPAARGAGWRVRAVAAALALGGEAWRALPAAALLAAAQAAHEAATAGAVVALALDLGAGRWGAVRGAWPRARRALPHALLIAVTAAGLCGRLALDPPPLGAPDAADPEDLAARARAAVARLGPAAAQAGATAARDGALACVAPPRALALRPREPRDFVGLGPVALGLGLGALAVALAARPRRASAGSARPARSRATLVAGAATAALACAAAAGALGPPLELEAGRAAWWCAPWAGLALGAGAGPARARGAWALGLGLLLAAHAQRLVEGAERWRAPGALVVATARALPHDPRAHAALGAALAETDPARALEHLDWARGRLAPGPEAEALEVARAHALARLGRAAEAEADLAALHVRAPRCLAGALALARALEARAGAEPDPRRARELRAEAERVARRAARARPSAHDAWFAWAAALEALGREREAEAALDRAIERRAEPWAARLARARLRARRDELEGALIDARAAARTLERAVGVAEGGTASRAGGHAATLDDLAGALTLRAALARRAGHDEEAARSLARLAELPGGAALGATPGR